VQNAPKPPPLTGSFWSLQEKKKKGRTITTHLICSNENMSERSEQRTKKQVLRKRDWKKNL